VTRACSLVTRELIIVIGVIPPFMRYLGWKAQEWIGFVRDCGNLLPPNIARLPATLLVRIGNLRLSVQVCRDCALANLESQRSRPC